MLRQGARKPMAALPKQMLRSRNLLGRSVAAGGFPMDGWHHVPDLHSSHKKRPI